MSLVSIVIPAYGQWPLTRQCLEALARDAASLPLIREVILVDNGAALPDAEPDLYPAVGAQLLGERFRYLPQAENRNFAGACNLGAAHATAPLLCLLNNDTVPQPGWLPPLAEALSAASAAGPLLCYPPTTANPVPRVQHLGICFSPQLRVSHLYERFPRGHRGIRRRAFQALTAAALLPRGLFLDLEGFDERFRNGFEDVELCARLKQRGHVLVCEPASEIWHLCGQSQGRRDHEEHNRKVLAQSGAPALFTPDEHLLLADDGYQLTLLPDMTWRADLAPREQARLDKLLKDQADAPTLAAALTEEPFWHQGRAGLCLKLAESNPNAALSLVWEAMHFDPSPAPLELLKNIATFLGDPALYQQADAALTSLPSPANAEQLRALRAYLRRACPGLVPEADRLLRGAL